LNELSIAHIDCDAYYAALHKRDNPSLRNVPVIVGGGKRGVVSTACYIARSYGVKSAMPAFMAKKLCPQAVFIKPNMKLYSDNAKIIRAIFDEITPAVETVSIDEAYLDLSGTKLLHGLTPAQLLAKISQRIEYEIGITISIGLSENKFLAKTASDMDKPRGFFILSKEDIANILWGREIGFLHGVGKATATRFNKLGYKNIGDIAKADKLKIISQFGDHGEWLYNIANGNDNRKVENEHNAKSISTETTFLEDIKCYESLSGILKTLCEKIARTARNKHLVGKTINIKLKTRDFKTITRQISTTPTQTAKTIFQLADSLLKKEMSKAPFRLIGIGLSELIDENLKNNYDLFIENDKNLDLERAIDKISDKFGKDIFKRF
jgi:DNA polymerase-4